MIKCIECGISFIADDWRCPSCGFAPKMVGKWPTFTESMAEEGPKEFGDQTYSRMRACEEYSFYTRSRLRLIRWAIKKYFPNLTNFYDFGAGTGFVLENLQSIKPGLDLYASDLSMAALSWVDSRFDGKVRLFHTDALHIPFTDHFDVLGAFDVVEHIDNDLGALVALHRAVKKGGGIVITAPQHMMLWSPLDEEAGHKRRYRGEELARKVRQAGFEVLLDTSFMAMLFLPQYFSRKYFTRMEMRKTFESENTLPAPINSLLEGMLWFELLLLRIGFRFPFGGTRIVAARKI